MPLHVVRGHVAAHERAERDGRRRALDHAERGDGLPQLEAGLGRAQLLVARPEEVPLLPGQDKSAKFPTSKAPLSAGFHSFRLIFGRAIISRNGLEAWMLFSRTGARGTLTLKRR